MSGVRTFAQSMSAREAQWIVIFTIEGSGRGSDGALYKYCSEVPSYAAGDALYRDWLIDWPQITPERADADGGVPTNGEIELAILNYQDTLTSEWRVEADASTFTSEALTAGETDVDVDLASGITAATLIYVGNEAMRVTSVAGLTCTVTRGQLDTDATAHVEGTPVHTYLPFIHSRRIRMYLVNRDAASSAQETEIANYRVDKFALHPSLNGFVLAGKSQMKWLSRLASRRPAANIAITNVRTGVVLGNGFRHSGIDFNFDRAFEIDANYYGSDVYARWDSSSRYYFKSRRTGEIFTVSLSGSGFQLVWDRGMLGTPIGELAAGDIWTLVFGADPDAAIDENPSFFRRSPGPSPSSSRSSGTWTKSAHWIDIILNLATSSAHVNDGLELANRNSTYGAWDCLPVGIGIGVPHAQIDWATALAVKHRAPEFVFPNFYIGDEPIPFGDLITEHFLRPLGAYLVAVGGQARIVMPRYPLAGQTAIAIGSDDMLGRPVSQGLMEHRLSARQDTSMVPTSIVFKGRNGEILPLNNEDYGPTFGQAGYYGHDERPLEIAAPSVRFENGRSQMLEERGHARLIRKYRPRWHLATNQDFSQYARAPGDTIAVTHEDLPNLAAGTQGWSSVFCELTRTKLSIDPDEGLRVDWEFFSYGPNVRVGKIAPAARIVSVASAGGGAFDVTVTANRYTQSDDLSGRPVTDASAFAVGDVLRLHNRVGTTVSATTATVTQIAGNVIRVDGDFGGTLAAGVGNAGQILRYAPRASAAAQQYDAFVFWADQVDNTVGASTQTPWKYGEP